MAHPCFNCGSECYCHGDIDCVIVTKTPSNCDSCGCDDIQNEDYFEECYDCDGHDACRDHGCAFENGCGHLVETDPARSW